MVRASWLTIGLLPTVAWIFTGCGGEGGPVPSTAHTPSERRADLDQARYERPITVAPSPAPVVPSTAAAPINEYRGYVVPDGYSPPMQHNLASPPQGIGPYLGGDKYAFVNETGFQSVKNAPLSTFSIDVDTASYAKTRSYLLDQRSLPPADAVRVEELINYFDYEYDGPRDEHPFAVHIETAQCPWQPRHRLVRFGVQGKRVDRERQLSNLVFLVDVSGSMGAPNRLPLVQRGLSMLARQLGENDRVAIVVYAGAAGLWLPSTSGSNQSAIFSAINRLRAGGSTNGGQGIQVAYQVARENFIQGGVNRVILCTDGDFNVGVTSTSDLVRMAQDRAKDGIYLTVLGFGFGNHNDAMLEELSNKANGNYAFIDSDREAHKVLVEQMQGTLVTIAKDVKLQVEFNPAQVAAYRLVGYENRRLADRDFNDDRKDAGDIGAGHSVTALYEIVPAGDFAFARPEVDPLKYQGAGDSSPEPEARPVIGDGLASELLTLKLRYQPPEGGTSTLLTFPVKDDGVSFRSASADLQFAAAVASFGMLLRNSPFKGDATYAAVLETAAATRGPDRRGRRGEFLELVRAAQQLSGERLSIRPAAWQPPRPAYSAPIYCPTPQPTQRSFLSGLAVGAIVAVGAMVVGALFATVCRSTLASCSAKNGTTFGPG